MTIESLFIIACASWYLSFALVKTDGPGGVFEWLREHVPHGRHGVQSMELIAPGKEKITLMHNGLLDCQICLIIWIALLLTLAPMGIVTYALAAAGLGLLLHGLTGWRISL